MAKEAEPQSLEALQSRQAKLEKIIEQRRHLSEVAIGTGRVKLGLPGIENLDNDERIDSTKTRVASSIPRLQNKLSVVTGEIETLTQTETLAEKAHRYQNEIAIRRAQIDKLREAVNADRIPEEILELREREFRQLASQPEKDKLLKRGLELLKERQQGTAQETIVEPVTKEEGKPPPEKEKITRISVNLSNNNVTVVDGQTGEVRTQQIEAVDIAILNRFSRSLGSPGLSVRTIAEVHRKAGKNRRWDSSNSIRRLRKLLEADPQNPIVLTQTGRTKGIQYQLNAEIEFTGESPRTKKGKEAAKKFDEKLPDGTVINIKGTLFSIALRNLAGASEEKPLPSDKLTMTLFGSDSPELRRNASNVITRLRARLEPHGWRIISMVPPLARAKGEIAKYYLERIEEVSQMEQAPAIQTDQDKLVISDKAAAAVALLIKHRAETLEKYGLRPIPVEIFKSLMARVTGKREITDSQLNELIASTLHKMLDIVRNDAVEARSSFYDDQNDDLKSLLVYFALLSPEKQSDLIEELLLTPAKTHVQIDRSGRVVDFWQSLEFESEPIESSSGLQQAEEESTPIEHDRTDEQPFSGEVPSEAIPTPEEITPPEVHAKARKLSLLEQRDPNVRNQINEYLDRIQSTGLVRFGPKQLVRFFDQLTRTVQKSMAEKGIVKPEVGRDGVHPSYSIHDATVMLYYNNFGNGLQKKHVRQLHRMVKEEIKKREENNQQNSGK